VENGTEGGAGTGEVDLTIRGVRAEALLKGRLDNAADIDRTITTIDLNPQILERLLQGV
jgi:acetolactate synthase regulatory subunit